MTHVPEEVQYRLLTHLAQRPDASQRELARELGISLGKLNYCLHALMEKGSSRRATSRIATGNRPTRTSSPQGLEEKINITAAFLRRKIAEYDTIAGEIERLKAEVQTMAEQAQGSK